MKRLAKKNTKSKIFLYGRVSTSEKEKNPVLSTLKSIFKSEGFVLFLIPIFAYLLTFLYYVGTFIFYNLPISLINFETIQIIPLCVIMFFILVACVNLGFAGSVFQDMFSNLFHNTSKKQKLIAKIISYLFLIVLVIISFMKYTEEKSVVRIFYFGISSVFLLTISYAVFFEFCFLSEEILFINKIKNSLKYFIYMDVIALFATSIITIGYLMAKDITSYYILNINPECVILYMNSEIIACRSFDRHKHVFFDSLKILPVDGENKYSISSEEIGHMELIMPNK